jgi:hypothetical protein
MYLHTHSKDGNKYACFSLLTYAHMKYVYIHTYHFIPPLDPPPYRKKPLKVRRENTYIYSHIYIYVNKHT